MKNKIMMAMLAAAMFSASQLSAYNVEPGKSYTFKDFEYSLTDGKPFNGSFPIHHDGEGNITCDKQNRLNTVNDFIFTYDSNTKVATLSIKEGAKAHEYEDCLVIGLWGNEVRVPESLKSDLPSTIILEEKK